MRGEGDDVGVDIDGTKEEGDADALEVDIDLFEGASRLSKDAEALRCTGLHSLSSSPLTVKLRMRC